MSARNPTYQHAQTTPYSIRECALAGEDLDGRQDSERFKNSDSISVFPASDNHMDQANVNE